MGHTFEAAARSMGAAPSGTDVLVASYAQKASMKSPMKASTNGHGQLSEDGLNNRAHSIQTCTLPPGPVPTSPGRPLAAGEQSAAAVSNGGAHQAAPGPQLSITDFIRGKTYLVTGVTGFMGTVLVEKILREAPEGTKIYVPIRNAPRMTYVDRFWKKVLPRDFFNLLRAQKGAHFEAFIREHLIPVEGDVDKPALGFAPEVLAQLQDEVEVIVHCAANTGFHVPLDEIMTTNTVGFMELLKIAGSCKRLKVCSTISTAYVHGGRPGVLPEQAVAADEPPSRWHALVDVQESNDANGTLCNGNAQPLAGPTANGTHSSEANGHVSIPGRYLDLFTELAHAKEATEAVRKQAEASGLEGKDLAKHQHKLLIAVGKKRAQQFGWHDSYTYSKALAELAAVRAADEYGIPMVILRPTIVESAMKEPAPGIIDSIACMEPLVFGIGRGAMDGFPCDPSLPLDIVPVDTSINSILAAIAASAGLPGTHVYQIGTSQCNPLVLTTIINVLFEYFSKHPMRDDLTGDIVKMVKHPVPYPDVPSFIASLQQRHDSMLADVDTSTPDGQAMQSGLARALRFTQYLAEIYHPYTNYKGVFAADNLLGLWDRLAPQERARYPFALHQIDWEDYLWNTHLPGIRKYLLDDEEEEWAFNNDSTLTVGRNF